MDCDDAVEATRTQRPDLVLLDIDLPRPNGLDALRRVKKALAQVEVLMLSRVDTPACREAAARNGADGFLPKFASLSSLLSALRQFTMEKAA